MFPTPHFPKSRSKRRSDRDRIDTRFFFKEEEEEKNSIFFVGTSPRSHFFYGIKAGRLYDIKESTTVLLLRTSRNDRRRRRDMKKKGIFLCACVSNYADADLGKKDPSKREK